MMVVAVARRGLRCSSCTKRIYSAAAAMGFLMGLVRERERDHPAPSSDCHFATRNVHYLNLSLTDLVAMQTKLSPPHLYTNKANQHPKSTHYRRRDLFSFSFTVYEESSYQPEDL